MPLDTVDRDDLRYDAVDPADVKMIDLFAGPGGLDVAAKWLGIPSVGIEVDEDACRTRVEAKLGTRKADVRVHKLLDQFPNATILTGGPPCQTYSVAGAGAGRRALDQVLEYVKQIAAGENVAKDLRKLEDERTGLVLEPLIWVMAALKKNRPFDTIVLEQVPTVKPVWDAYEVVLRKLGYDVLVDIVHTERYGVPQTRRRAVLIACRERIAYFPEETHRPYNKNHSRPVKNSSLLEWETIGNALKPPSWVCLLKLPKRPDSFEVISNYGTGGIPEKRGRRKSNEPSATVTGKVRRNRVVVVENGVERDIDRFDPAEAGRLQTFPLNYPWRGVDKYQQIGNAIPPRLGVHILAAALFGMKPNPVALDAAVSGSWAHALAGEHQLQTSLEPLRRRLDIVELGQQSELFPIDLDAVTA